MELGLTGKLAVVTGASKGIGLAITRALVAEGATVVAGSRGSSPELQELTGVRSVEVDLSTTDGPQQLVDSARELGAIDVLVNNVGGGEARARGGFGGGRGGLAPGAA